MKRNKFLLISCISLLMSAFVSCTYEKYADADYPETTIYQPLAYNAIWNINSQTAGNPFEITPGTPKKYELDKLNNKFIVFLGVVQAGIELKTFDVDITIDHSIVNTMIADNRLPIGTLPLPESEYSLPSSIKMDPSSASAAFQMEINLNTLTGANAGRKYAVAVKIFSSSVAVNRELDTVVICIDTDFIQNLL